MTAPSVATAALSRTRPRALAAVAALWVLLDAVVLLGTFPYWPRTTARWALLLVAGPAMFLSLAGLLELGVLPRLRRASASPRAARWAAVLVVASAVALAAWWTLRVEGP